MKNTYKVGDHVTFLSSTGIRNLSEEDCNGEFPFEFCDVTLDMLKRVDSVYDAKIVSIDDEGDLKFDSLPYTWPVEVISGYSHNQPKDV